MLFGFKSEEKSIKLINQFEQFIKIAEKAVDECQVNPCDSRCNLCGANSVCKNNNGIAVCSCSPGFIGSAPNCRPECVVSSECDRDKACVKQKCVNPCVSAGICGTNADCRVNNHSPICTCRNGFTGNPFTVCNQIPRTSIHFFLFIVLA